jgi:isopenicillin-N N-acyltransferase-like protein
MMKWLRKILFVLVGLGVVIWLALQVSLSMLEVDPPFVGELSVSSSSVSENAGFRGLNGNWYHQNQHGLWEAYIEGTPYERGRTFGLLAEEQIVSQEVSFIAQIRKLIPSESFLNSLKYGVVFFNRNLDEHVTKEYQKEIFGVSESFSDDYDFIGAKYSRILNYHAAHDIGHALQDLSIVGCTSFAAWDGFSADSSLVIGRNFDFYMGDDFAKDKIILFMNPDSGYAFASITWAGFMGVVSGMNEHGLTVTLNAAKSSIPSGAKTPISLLAREILQYARTIDEAYEIAKSRNTFVSESILIGSAADHSAAIIEKSPDRIDIYRPENSRLVCSNHYQSETFSDDPVNLKNIEESDTDYRFKRMNQLLDEHAPVDPEKTVEILRDQKGLDGAELGMGNPKAINQLLAHHGVAFQPEKRLMWVSTNPFQLGEFLCYDLNEVFSKKEKGKRAEGSFVVSLTIPADDFLNSTDFQKFLRYKEKKNQLFDNVALGKDIEWNDELEQEFINSNPESYIMYSMLGDYYLEQGDLAKAKTYFETCLTKEVASKQEREKIELNLKECH